MSCDSYFVQTFRLSKLVTSTTLRFKGYATMWLCLRAKRKEQGNKYGLNSVVVLSLNSIYLQETEEICKLFIKSSPVCSSLIDFQWTLPLTLRVINSDEDIMV